MTRAGRLRLVGRWAGRRQLVALGAFGALLLMVPQSVAAKSKSKKLDAVDLTNFQLSPGFAQWLVGPIAGMASEKEQRAFMALSTDAGAEAFIEAFWERRGPNLVFPPTGPKITFDERAEEADKRFTEGTLLGRRSDRGTIFVLYGEPVLIDYASSPTRGGEPIEVWNYSGSRPEGLDGKRPKQRYGFRKDGSVTRSFPLSAARKLRKNRTPGGAVPPP